MLMASWYKTKILIGVVEYAAFSRIRVASQAASIPALPLHLIGVWELVAQTHLFARDILIPPQQVFRTFLDLLADGELIDNIEASGARVLKRIRDRCGAGLIAGMAMGLYPALERYFGLSHGHSASSVHRLGPVADRRLRDRRNLQDHYHRERRLLSRRAQHSGRRAQRTASPKRRRSSIPIRPIGPDAEPGATGGSTLNPDGVRLALSRSWMIVVAAELFAASSGIGHMMDWGRQMFQIDVVMVGVVVTGVVGFILDQNAAAGSKRISQAGNCPQGKSPGCPQ